MIELLITASIILLIIITPVWIVTGIKNTGCKSCKYSYLKGYCNPHRYCEFHNKYVQDDFICAYYQGGKRK